MKTLTCNGCAYDGACERQQDKRAALRGLGITTVKFICKERRDAFAPGQPVIFTTHVVDEGDEYRRGPMADTANSVRLTAEHFGQTEDQKMSGLYMAGTDTVICHTGTSPNSPETARILTGLWNHAVQQAKDARAALSEPRHD